ncbi:MAG TPA: glycosyltransferase family 4 protein [Stellaceae bacterium]|nr:glycosyltransferase family 4 protein [Stellaceae bacterium]
MLSIVVICDHAHVSGGLAKVAIGSACALRRRGHRVILLAGMAPVAPELAAAGVETLCLGQQDLLSSGGTLGAGLRAIWNTAAPRALARILAGLDRRNAVIHIHGWSKLLSPSIVAASRRSGVALVQTLHDYVALCPNGAFFNYVGGANCPLRPLSPSCLATNCDARHAAHKAWRVARHAVLFARAGASGDSDFIYLSEFQRRVIAPHLPEGVRLHLVPNPVEVEKEGRAAVAQNRSFVFIGRLSREKGPELFARAAASAGVPAVFIGDGPEEKRLRALAPEAEFTGWLDRAALTSHLRSARALVFPSLWYETFGLAVYEAMAHGVPAIVSDNTAPAAAIEHGVTGLRFRSGLASDLARQITALGYDGLAERIGGAAYARYWRAPLTLERHIDCLEEVYARVLRRRWAAAVAMPAARPMPRSPAVPR